MGLMNSSNNIIILYSRTFFTFFAVSVSSAKVFMGGLQSVHAHRNKRRESGRSLEVEVDDSLGHHTTLGSWSLLLCVGLLSQRQTKLSRARQC